MNLSILPNPNVAYKIRYQDEDLLVVEKPARLVTQPGLGHEDDTLLNGLFATFGQQLQNLGKARDYGLLHRLDRQTSGLLIVGLKPRAYDALRDDFANRRIKKFYWAVAAKAPNKPTGTIKRPILEVTEQQKTSKISSAGKPALTAYRTLQTSKVGEGRAALIECRPVTGRLHQIRVHLNSIGCPILGDEVYAPKSKHSVSARLALHAHRIIFNQPTTGELIDIQSPWPRDLGSLLKRLGFTKPETTVGAVGLLPGERVTIAANDALDDTVE